MARKKTKPRKSIGDTIKKDVDLSGLAEAKEQLDSKTKATEESPSEPAIVEEQVNLRRLSVDLDENLVADFKAWCAKNRTTLKAQIDKMIREKVESE